MMKIRGLGHLFLFLPENTASVSVAVLVFIEADDRPRPPLKIIRGFVLHLRPVVGSSATNMVDHPGIPQATHTLVPWYDLLFFVCSRT